MPGAAILNKREREKERERERGDLKPESTDDQPKEKYPAKPYSKISVTYKTSFNDDSKNFLDKNWYVEYNNASTKIIKKDQAKSN